MRNIFNGRWNRKKFILAFLVFVPANIFFNIERSNNALQAYLELAIWIVIAFLWTIASIKRAHDFWWRGEPIYGLFALTVAIYVLSATTSLDLSIGGKIVSGLWSVVQLRLIFKKWNPKVNPYDLPEV